MLLTPEKIRTLQRKLYRKAKQEPGYRFHALYDKVYRADILSHAYNLARANKGSAGIDGITFEAIESAEGITAFLAELEEALRNKTYKPDPVKRVMIPKSDGSQRPLGIPTIRDRVAQMAVKLVIEPIFEADFCDTSAVFRQILERLELTLNEAKTKIVNAFTGRFDFLGFTIGMGRGRKTGKYYPHVQPSKRSLQVIKDRVTALTRRGRTNKPLEWLVKEVNATMRGWVGYFHYRNCSNALVHLRDHVEVRLITHLRKRHKIRDRISGFVRFPRRSLYLKYGLYMVPRTAAWTKRMPRGEEHRKAVCGRTACTV